MLAGMPATDDPRLLVGVDTFDDAGAYRLAEDLVLLQTADVISPVCDDPYVYGQVAAANSLSDVYAMGGKPCTALNLAFFPAEMPTDLVREVLRGAWDKCREAGAAVVGGHTVNDADTKFGLSVAGTCRPEQLLPNRGARPGDALVLTKPVGTGLMMSSHRKEWVDDAEFAVCLDWMAHLNRTAATLAVERGAHAATDVTGFGLAGHAAEMARASGVRLVFDFDAIPAYPGWRDLVERGARTGITADNLRLLEENLHGPMTAAARALLADPQTSGGLLISIAATQAEALVAKLRDAGESAAAIVGEVTADSPGIALG